MNSPDLCRICLRTDENAEMELLINNVPEESTIIQKIELCGGIKLEIRDDLPRKICKKCLHSLNVSYDFRTLCQANDQRLRNVCAAGKLEIKDEPQLDRMSPGTIFMSELSNESSVFNATDEPKVKKESVEVVEATKPKAEKRAFPATRRVGKKPKPKEMQICELCGNVYTRPSSLMLHMRRHAAEKPYSCEICMRKFTCQSEINRHMRVHTGVRPFKCQYCDRKFSDRSTNIKHERTHTNERPFSCTTCGKAFTYSNVLKNHMLTHTGEKRFRCDICNKKFSRTHQLKQHLHTLIHQQREAKLNHQRGKEQSNISCNALDQPQ